MVAVLRVTRGGSFSFNKG